MSFAVLNGTVSDGNSHCEYPSSNRVELPSLARNSKYVCDGRQAFNICGQKYEVLNTTLRGYPNTLLADEERMAKFWDEKRQEFFLDRNRACFEAVLTYYQSKGILSRPHGIPESLFFKELQFYDLGDDVQRKFKVKDDHQQKRRNGKTKRQMPKSRLQRRFWKLFEYPETSNAARCIAWLSCTVVLLSIVLFCIETLPQFEDQDESGKTKNHDVFFTIEATCISWFTFEYLTRLLSSPNKWKFIKEALNVIDLVAILPFFVTLALQNNESNVSAMAILRIVRLVRVFRIFKLSRYSAGLQILGMTLRASLSELGLLVFFLSVGVVLFASAVYAAERSDGDTDFKSIPHSFWWAVITMTTVGYGDMYPKTLLGKLIGSVCACTGILAIALPVPVIVANFERFYRKSQEQVTNNASREKAEKYKALKGFFDRLKRRSTRNRSTSFRTSSVHESIREDTGYCDMSQTADEKVKMNSNKTDQESPLVVEKRDGLSGSNV